MRFTKMQGAGNDFIIINNIGEHIPESRMSGLAERLCGRRISIGADGMMFVDKPSRGGDFSMKFYNCDGSVGEMCGNGARCISRYGYEKGLAGENLNIETTSGMVAGRRIDTRRYQVRLNDPTVSELDHNITADGRVYRCAYIELGDPGLPHLTVDLPEFDTMDEDALFELGRKMRWHESLPKGANVTFYRRTGPQSLKIRTFERGVEGFTLACGTGSASVAVTLALRGEMNPGNIELSMPGGVLSVSLKVKNGRAYDLWLTGPTTFVAEGEILDEDL